MTGHLVSHIVRRGVQHALEQFSQRQAYIEQLQQDAELYEKHGDPVNPAELLPVVITVVVALLVIWSIDYTIGQVMSSLAMIESPSTTAIIKPSKSPAYADEPDEPDAPLEKEALMPSEAEADVEVTLINHKPITAKITTTMSHLHRIGGFTARWRGLGMAVFYHLLHALVTNALGALLVYWGVLGQAVAYTVASVALCRVHMAWTQKMVTYPSKQWWFRRLPARKDCKALLLPSLVYAVAEQATLALPMGVAVVLGVAGPNPPAIINDGNSTHENCSKAFLLALKFLAVPTTYFTVAFLILLPASVTLTRIEAALLPEGDETIVPFDKAAVLGASDLSVRAGRRAVFVEAWRSFDRSSRLRVIKLYAKMFLAEVTVAIVGAHLVFAELYFLGPERIATLIKSATAQMKMAAIERAGGNFQ